MSKSATIWRPQSGTGDVSTISTTFLITDSSNFLITDSGNFLILDTSVVSPKVSTPWSSTDIKTSTGWRIDGSGDLGSGATATRTTVLADTRVTVSGDIRVTADGSYTPKSGSVWVDA